MNRNDIWNLFRMTGKIEYFMKYKDMVNKGMVVLGDNEGKGNNN